ncbi:MAG TPA: TIGR03790 family protein [Bryobacteraceae bacterium]|nr:TIGR03790 family protein [Bryobacteraceae bacterium]
MRLRLAVLLAAAPLLFAQKPDNVLVVINQQSPVSRSIGEYYVERRHIPLANICRLSANQDEDISRDDYDNQVARPIAAYLRRQKLQDQILYIVTTSGVPLRIKGNSGTMLAEAASVDSELTLLYSDMRGSPHSLPAGIRNPFFGKFAASFRHPDFPIYLVTRLTGFDFADVKGIIDRALVARNRGNFVIDLKQLDSTPGNGWLRNAARDLPKERVILDDSGKVLYNQRDVIGYASWGSNDPERKQREVGFQWLPGAIMTEYVSTNGRSFARPPETWKVGSWDDAKTWFVGSPQTLTADYIRDGATGASGHVYEPFLQFTPRPDILLPAYYHGRNLAESYYLAIPALSWMNVVVGDPLCALGKP